MKGSVQIKGHKDTKLELEISEENKYAASGDDSRHVDGVESIGRKRKTSEREVLIQALEQCGRSRNEKEELCAIKKSRSAIERKISIMTKRKTINSLKIIERKSQINSRTEKKRKVQEKKDNAKEKKGESKTMDWEEIVEETESGDSGQEGQTGASTKVSESETNNEIQSINLIDTNRNRIKIENKD